MQSLIDGDPSMEEYVPRAQSLHADESTAPGSLEYLPAAHSVHVLLDDAASVLDQVPARQERQNEMVAAPTEDEYVP
jgi:hypothetical protein